MRVKESHVDHDLCPYCHELIEAGDPGCRCGEDPFACGEERGDYLYHRMRDEEAEERI